MLSHKTEYSIDNGSSWVLHTASEPVGPGKVITITGLTAGTYDMLLRITPTTGDGPAVTSPPFQLVLEWDLTATIVSFATVSAALSVTPLLSGNTIGQAASLAGLAVKLDGAVSSSTVAAGVFTTGIRFNGGIIVAPRAATAVVTTGIKLASPVQVPPTILSGLLNDIVVNTTPSSTITFSNFEESATVQTPTAFTFPDVTEAASWGEWITSADSYMAGLTAAADISVVNGKYSIGIGAFVSTPGTISNGQRLRLQVYSSTTSYGSETCTVTVGTYSTTFTAISGE
ncbi:MAG: hypothetical protein HGA20_14980 [Geobacteraceae bacterium]|nr:hypothetical protein [Geobacteraceae bacterium]